MSLISTESQSVAPEVAPTAAPHRFVAPKKWSIPKINLQMTILLGVALLLISAPFVVWVRNVMDGGIVNHGNYSEVNLKAMSTFDLDQVNGRVEDVPEKFRALEGARVALVGQMWQPRDAGDGSINYFQLVYSKTKCCFNGPPLAQHFVDSNVMPSVHSVYYYGDEMVRVWGTLHIKFRHDGGVIKSVYEVDVDKVDEM